MSNVRFSWRKMPWITFALMLLCLIAIGVVMVSYFSPSSRTQFLTKVDSFNVVSRSELTVDLSISNVSDTAATPACVVSVGPIGGFKVLSGMGVPGSGEATVTGAPAVAPGHTIPWSLQVAVSDDDAELVTSTSMISVLGC